MEGDNGRPRTNPRAITLVLIVLVIVGVVYSVINIFDMKAEIARLEANHASLQATQNKLQTRYDQLKDDNAELETLLSQLQLDNAHLQRLLEEYEQVPHDYYYSGGFAYHSNTYPELCDFLDYEFQPTLRYERDVFDCTESSAYVEWALENAGVDDQIVDGPTPWSQTSGFHSWIIVNTQTQQVAIEATIRPRIVYKDAWDATAWQNYYHGYYALYENVYEAIRHGSIQQWDWREVI